MERLTKITSNGKIGYALLGPGECVDVIDLLHVWGDRLAAYEDTGLEPEEITTEPYGCVFYCNRKCNLYGDFCAEGPGCPDEIGAEAVKHLLELAKAEEDGRLVVLPCKVGDTVYRVITTRDTAPILTEIEIKSLAQAVELIGKIGEHKLLSWYLTREEAEAALKKREEADNEAD